MDGLNDINIINVQMKKNVKSKFAYIWKHPVIMNKDG